MAPESLSHDRPADFTGSVGAAASRLGIERWGIVDLELARPAYEEHLARYDAWLARERGGEMGYLARGRDRRADPRLLLPSARSVFCAAFEYSRATPARSSSDHLRYARYLRGEDYHPRIGATLDALARRVREAFPVLEWKTCVDASAVLERAWGWLAGLGWIGKNTMLLHPREGSYSFLGVVLFSEASGRSPAPQADLCGHCRACHDACPTQAFTAPRELDARRCISYLTLEKRGPFNREEARSIGGWLAGCDLCQEACPFNRKPTRGVTPAPDPALLADRAALLSESEEAYRARVARSALKRVKPKDFRRNLEAALENTSNQD